MDDSDDTVLLFAEHRTAVIGFNSTTSDYHQHDVRHQECATDPMPSMHEQNTSTNACIDIGIQTIDPLSTISGLAAVDEKLLALWLQKISPLVERELLLGPTPISNHYVEMFTNDSDIHAAAHQVLTIGQHARHDRNDDALPQLGCAAWMSVVTQNAPMLAVAASSAHTAWCDHTDSSVEIFMPRRNKSSNNIFYAHFCSLAAKGCVQTMAANPHSKDMLAAGSFSGDVSVWLYDPNDHHTLTSNNAFVDVPSDQTYQYGCVVGLAWLPPKLDTAKGQQSSWLLSAHADGMVVLWQIVVNGGGGQQRRMTTERTFVIKSSRNPKEAARISAIAVLSIDQFVIGTEEGNVYLCSASSDTLAACIESESVVRRYSDRPTPVGASKVKQSIYDPIVGELNGSHRFAVAAVRTLNSSATAATATATLMLMTVDVSGEMFIRSRLLNGDAAGGLDDLSASVWQVLRMPLRLRKHVAGTRDGRFLMCAGSDGALELISVSGNPPRRSISGQCIGHGSLVVFSDNECWAVTGMYEDRSFQLFQVRTN